MPPNYDDFDTAWTDFVAKYSSWRTNLTTIEGNVDVINNFADAGNWKSALNACAASFYLITYIHRQCLDMVYSDWTTNHFMESIYHAAHEPVGAEITMDAILSAMVTATPDELQYFIGLVDAYRQSLWNRPFNREYFAALARGFMEWE